MIPAGQADHRRRGARGGRPRAAQRHGRARAGGRGVRAGVRRPPRRRPHLRRRQLRHVGPAPRPARRRHRRRATRSSCRRSPSRRRPTRSRSPARRRCSPTSSPTLLPRPGRRRGRVTERTKGDHAGAPVRPPGRHGRRCRRSPTGTACGSSRTPRRPTARATTAGPSARSASFAMFSLYPTKNMTSGEGGMVSCVDRRPRPPRAPAAQPGHGEAVRERARRPQQPDDRHPRGHRPGAAHQGRRAGRPSGRPTPPSSTRTSRAWSCRRSPTAACTSTTSTRSGWPTTATALRQGAARGARRRHGRLLPDPQPPPAVASERELDLPVTEKAAREVLSLPVHPSLSQADLETHRRRPSTRS